MLKGILHVNLTISPGAAALAEAHHFYVQVLGLEVLERPDSVDSGSPGWWLGCQNGQQIHISAEQNPDKYNAPSSRHAAFQVESLEVLQQRLQENGVTIISDSQFAGQRRFFVRDPWGNRLEFVEIL
ncbi:MAG: VOC family protein [Chloroflexi bacterium]|uniref:VOC family protein n=1 Tax=Candidatus Chlorohelix allophototropha TaxID=3003348 RepID=A0A8T7M6W4_9CHLR|nr:VOC family protein [Chloroflexota bacterium]WJW69762.1 VOC family protein [Chloroflexota bacterium L227-S17]